MRIELGENAVIAIVFGAFFGSMGALAIGASCADRARSAARIAEADSFAILGRRCSTQTDTIVCVHPETEQRWWFKFIERDGHMMALPGYNSGPNGEPVGMPEATNPKGE